MSDQLPWQLKLSEIFTRVLTPDEIERREPYWREDDRGLHSPLQNALIRLRSYASDGHDYRQEVHIAAGESAGQLILGNDRALDHSAHVTFGDILMHVGSMVHMQTENDKLVWNNTPFNPVINPTMNMPSAVTLAQDMTQFAEATVPGTSQGLSALSTAITAGLAIAGADGFAKFDTPFHAWTSLNPHKLPMWNAGAIAFMQLLFKGGTDLWLCGAPGSPLVPTPKLLALLPLIKQNYDTAFNGSNRGEVLGKTVKDLLKSAVPGLGLILH